MPGPGAVYDIAELNDILVNMQLVASKHPLSLFFPSRFRA
jgi:hypothetical protein